MPVNLTEMAMELLVISDNQVFRHLIFYNEQLKKYFPRLVLETKHGER